MDDFCFKVVTPLALPPSITLFYYPFYYPPSITPLVLPPLYYPLHCEHTVIYSNLLLITPFISSCSNPFISSCSYPLTLLPLTLSTLLPLRR